VSVIALSTGTPGAPRLREDVTIVEQVFRGETSYVVKDPATQKYFRFRPVEVGVMRCFDGRRTPDEIVAELAAQGLRLTTAAVEGFARKLAGIGLLERSLADRTTLELERIRAERRRRRQPALFRGELLRMRWSFGDPDALFNRVMPAIRWMFTPAFIWASAALFAVYFVILAATWDEFSKTLVELYSLSSITLATVVILWVTALVVILIHELGHGFTCKYFGGEVHELGFMLIYFQPAFYCNVNDAWSFPALRARLWVTAAGSWIQLVIASLAAIVWLVARPGTLASEVAVAAILMGGATTIISNANPLLPLDGYFALTDWLEIPNLRMRALGYFGWWVRRHVLRLDLPEPDATARERRVFLIYGSLAFCYIGAILTFIGLWVVGRAQQALGVAGAIVTVGLILLMARHGLATWGRSIALALRARRSDRTRSTRWWWRPTLAAVAVVVLLALIPWTVTTSGRFTVAPRRVQNVTSPDSGVIAQVFVQEGMRVMAGVPMARLVDHGLEHELLRSARAVDSLSLAVSRARAAATAGVTERLEAERAEAAARLASIQTRLDALVLRAQWTGVVITPRVQELVGLRVDAGDEIMRVAMLDSLEARIALAHAGAASVRPGQVVHLITLGAVAEPIDGVVGVVAPAGGGAAEPGTIEVRVRVGQGTAWRAGATGEASVEIRRSTMLAALWWSVRQRIRGDVLL